MARDPLDDCVHCGFCLPACPTYQAWGEEMDSPRGRIDLMRGLREGRVELGPVVLEHFDRCLGCMACLAACPSGVRYDVLIERTRAELEARQVRPLADRLHRALLFALFPHPGRLRALVPLLWLWQRTGLAWLARRLGLLRLVPRRLAQLDALAPDVRLGSAFHRLPAVTRPAGPPRLRVALVEGCVQRVFFDHVNAATLRVLAAEGCEVLVPPGQGCCGALSVHAGREAEAQAFARALVDRLEPVRADVVVVNAAGCGSHLKELGRLLGGDPAYAARAAALAARVRDVSEVLAALPAAAPRHPLALRVAYQPSCHLAHAQRLREGPVALLRAIPGLELHELSDACCGSAGIYNLVEPEAAAEIGGRKVDAVAPIHPDVVAAGNPGCLLQLRVELGRRGLAVRLAHPVELIDASIRGEA
jgi:glycolate oxidase iron-sulfur subunit